MSTYNIIRKNARLFCSSGLRASRGKNTEIVDSEIGTLHLSVDDADDKLFTRKSKGVSESEFEEDLRPYGTSGPHDGGKMERSLNQVTLMGRVGNDPVMRGTRDKPVTVFSLATNTSWRTPNPGPKDSDWTHRTDWHNIAVFKKGLREQAYNYVCKGQRIHVQGKLLYGEVTDAAGIKRHTTTIAADDIIYITNNKKD